MYLSRTEGGVCVCVCVCVCIPWRLDWVSGLKTSRVDRKQSTCCQLTSWVSSTCWRWESSSSTRKITASYTHTHTVIFSYRKMVIIKNKLIGFTAKYTK